jgi:hypothetical protein
MLPGLLGIGDEELLILAECLRLAGSVHVLLRAPLIVTILIKAWGVAERGIVTSECPLEGCPVLLSCLHRSHRDAGPMGKGVEDFLIAPIRP